jgi:SAM-dependent methyltransferase
LNLLQTETEAPNSDYQYLEKHRTIWQQKAILRRLYAEQYYARLLNNLSAGSHCVEIGSGPGLMAEFAPHVIRTDILHNPFVNLATDAHYLPFAIGSIDNVVGLDVLHHFNQPLAVLREVSRVLRSGGRFVLVEPYITPFSRLIYTYFHQEECDLSVQPWQEHNQFEADKNAFDGNAAIPYLLLEKSGTTLQDSLPELRLIQVQKFSLITYLLSGGFKPFSLLPDWLYPPLQRAEDITEPLWRNLAALRALIIWEKR